MSHGGEVKQVWPDLGAVIRERLIDLAFQPIVRTITGDIIAVEALTRPRPESGFPNPGVLFAAADAFGKSWDLELVVRDTIADSVNALPPDRLLFFNTSPSVFADERYPEEIERFRERSGLTPEHFVLEITERAEGEQGALERNAILLRERGYQVAIDDMGAGSSGLNRIMSLRPAWLKLDRELIRGIDKDAYRQNLVRFLAYFTRLGGARLIAEGVEELDELNTLFDLGADCVQGYALARPGVVGQELPTDLVDWMRERGATVVHETSFVERLRTIDALTIPASACRVPPAARGPELDSAATIADALLAVADRADVESLVPLAIRNASGGMLALRPSDLLRAAAKQLGEDTLHSSPMFDMPDSFACDMAMHRRIVAGDNSDVAIIDVRRMSDYNAAVGHDLGDLLLRHLATLLRSSSRAHRQSFVGHLGDDRFLLIAPSGVVSEIVEELVLRFDRASVRYASGSGSAHANNAAAPEGTSEDWLASPSLRVVVLPGVFRAVRGPREVRRLADNARERTPTTALGGSRVVVVPCDAGEPDSQPDEGTPLPFPAAA